MTRATKKELNEVLKPLFTQAKRYAMSATTGGTRAPAPDRLEWRGLTLDIQIVRRAKVVTGVPFPFALFEFWYEAHRDGKCIVQVGGRPDFIDAVFRVLA